MAWGILDILELSISRENGNQGFLWTLTQEGGTDPVDHCDPKESLFSGGSWFGWSPYPLSVAVTRYPGWVTKEEGNCLVLLKARELWSILLRTSCLTGLHRSIQKAVLKSREYHHGEENRYTSCGVL